VVREGPLLRPELDAIEAVVGDSGGTEVLGGDEPEPEDSYETSGFFVPSTGHCRTARHAPLVRRRARQPWRCSTRWRGRVMSSGANDAGRTWRPRPQPLGDVH
jgi:hypothetical protein